MTNVIGLKGRTSVEKKTVSISAKRQITIPQKFYTILGFTDEAECVIRGNELVIRPVRAKAGGEFAEQILKELLDDGLSGEELLAAFREKQAKIRPAVEAMLADAERVARGEGDYFGYDDIFGSEDDQV